MRKLFAVGVFAFSPILASAGMLPDGGFTWEFTDDAGVTVNVPSSFLPQNRHEWTLSGGTVRAAGCYSNSSGALGCWNDSIHFGPGQSISTQMHYSGPATSPILESGGSLYRWYEVMGPADVTVPLDFAISETASAGGTGNASVLAFTDTGAGVQGICAYTSNPATCEGYPNLPSLATTVSGTVVANVPTEFTIEVIGGIGPVGGAAYFGNFSGTVDPQIAIDPRFTLPGYSLIFGTLQLPESVPEPDTVALLAGGLAALAFRIRRRSGAN